MGPNGQCRGDLRICVGVAAIHEAADAVTHPGCWAHSGNRGSVLGGFRSLPWYSQGLALVELAPHAEQPHRSIELELRECPLRTLLDRRLILGGFGQLRRVLP